MFAVEDRKHIMWFEGETEEELKRFVQFVMDGVQTPEFMRYFFILLTVVKGKISGYRFMLNIAESKSAHLKKG